MNKFLTKFTSIAISLMLIIPNTAFAAGRNASQREVAKLITSAESPSDKSGLKESALGILSAIFAKKELINITSIVDSGEALAVDEFEREYRKWFNLISDNPDARIIASKNAREVLIKKYKAELELLFPKNSHMNYSKRAGRVLLESKLFTVENIYYTKHGTIAVTDAIANSKVISKFSADLMTREYLESLSSDLAKAIDISGPHGYMGYSMRNIQETVASFLNDIVENSHKALHAGTYEKRVVAMASADRAIRAILRAVFVPEAKESFSHFLSYLRQTLKKGGPLCLAGGAVIGIGLLFMASSNASAQNISNSRLAVSRELNATLNAAPSLLAAKVIALKQVYGTTLVSSVISENSATMLPLLKEQFAAMQRPEVKQYADYLLGETFDSANADAARDIAVKKAQVITAVRDNTNVRIFNEKMKSVKLK